MAVGALDALAELQAHDEDPAIDAEPGKIVHEVREWPRGGVLVPALLRLDRLDAALPRPPRRDLALDGRRTRSSRGCASRRCARSSGSTATATATATASSSTAARATAGLANQSWKDSGDSQRFHDGRSPRPRSRRSRCRATCTTRSSGSPRSRARSGASTRSRTGSSARRTSCGRASTRRSGSTERGGFYALALDGEKRQVDARCSNMGHLLWSGIVLPERVGAVVDQLLSESLWSGWGIRTMASRRGRVQPDQLPQRHRLAARHVARRVGPRAPRLRRGGAPHRARADRGGGALRLVAAGGLRGLRARRDAVPDRLSDRRPPAGLGGRHADPPRARPPRDRARPRAAAARVDRRGRASELARGAARRGRAGAYGRDVDGCRSSAAMSRSAEGSRDESGLRMRRSSVPSGSRCRRRRTAGPSASSRCSPTDSSTPATRSRSSPRATRRRAPGSSPSSTPRRASGSATRSGRCSTSCTRSGARRVRRPPRPHGLLGLAFGGLVDTPFCHTVHGPLDGQPGRLYEEVVDARAEREADLDLDEPAQAEARASPGSRTARTRSTSRCTRSGASRAATTSSSSGA